MTQSRGLDPAELRRLAELGSTLASGSSEAEVLEALFTGMEVLVPVNRISVARYYPDENQTANSWESGAHVPSNATSSLEPLEGSLAAFIFHTGVGFMDTDAGSALLDRFPLFAPTIEAGFKSIIAVPLRSPDAIFGILHLQSLTPGQYDDHNLIIAEAIGLHLGSALTSIGLRENLSRELQKRAAMSAIAQIINSADEIDAVYDRFATALGELVPADRVVISIVDVGDNDVRDAYVAGLPIEGFEQGDIHPVEPSATSVAIRERRTMALDQRSDEVEGSIDEFADAAEAAGLTHLIVAPLIQNGEVFGSVQVRSVLERPYSEKEIALIDEIVAQISGAISNDLLRSDLKLEATRHNSLAEIARIAGEAHTFDDLGNGILPIANRLLPVLSLTLRTVSLESQTSTTRFVKWLPGLTGELSGSTQPLEGSASGVAATTRNSIRFGPDTDTSDLPALTRAQSDGYLAGVHVPLVSNDEVVGILIVDRAESINYSDQEVELLERIGQQIAGPMASLELRERREQESAERQALADIGRAAVTSGTAQEMGDRTFEDLSGLVGISRLAIVHSGSDRQRFRYVYANIDEGEIVGQEFSLGDSLTGRTILSGEVISFGDSNRAQLLDDFPGFSGFLNWGLARGVSLPLIANDIVIGTMIAGDDLEGDYSTSRVEFLSRVADQVAGAIDNIVLRDELTRESNQTLALAEIGRAVSRSLDYNVIGDTIYGHLMRLMGISRLIITTVSDDGQTADIIYANVPTTIGGSTIAELEGSFTGRTIVSGELQMFGSSNVAEILAQFPQLKNAIHGWGFSRAISVPLIARNKVIGTLMFGDGVDDDYSGADGHFAQRVADQVSGAIAMAQQRQSEQREAEIQELLNRISRAATGALEPAALFDQIEKELQTEFEYDRFEALLADSDGETLRFVCIRGVSVDGSEQGEIVPVSVQTLRSWGPILERSASDSPKHDHFIESGLNSWIQVPIGFPSAPPIGFIGIRSLSNGAYDEEDAKILARIASQITPATQNVRNYQQSLELTAAQARSRELEAEARELERVNEEKSRFLATVTHELKTPLTSIQAFTDILRRNREGNLTKEQIRNLEVSARNARRLGLLIDDLVDVSQIQLGSFEIHQLEFDMVDLTNDLVESMRPIFEEKSQTLNYRLQVDTIWLRADRSRIAQVIINLLSNASKYSPDGSTIEFSVDTERSNVLLEFQDDGVGIAAADMNQIFTPLFRADNEETRAVPGTGIGLAIVKKIVDLHGGEIDVSSQPGVGSKFKVSMPRQVSEPSEQYLAQQDDIKSNGEPRSRLRDISPE